jgi:hypothetical protein
MNYHWIGHCKEGNSDKVWGLIRLTDRAGGNRYWADSYVAVWGRRGKKLQTKVHESISAWEADKLCSKKQVRGYNTINPTRLDDVYPEFENDLQATTVWALLSV